MRKKSFWFYIESYVHVFRKSNDILLYNALNGDTLEYRNKPAVARFAKRVCSDKHSLVLRVTQYYLSKHPEIADFIKDVRDKFMGDIVDTAVVRQKPFQMMPILNIQKDLNRVKKFPVQSTGENLMAYLNEISIHINNACDLNCSVCGEAFKQFLCCHKDEGKQELDIEKIKSLLEEARESSLSQLNILGGNIFKYKDFVELVEFLSKWSFPKVYYVHYKNLMEGKPFLNKLLSQSTFLNILVTPDIEENQLKDALNLIKKEALKAAFIFVLQNSDNIEAAQRIISQFKIFTPLLYLYYNKSNLTLFKEHVFIKDRAMILETKPTSKDIFTRMKINPIYFGKLYITAHGNIYCNPNGEKLGRLGIDSLYDITYTALFSRNNSWRRLRGKVEPCRKCVFSFLCPPLTNYEYAIGRNNLCHIWKETGMGG